MSEVLEFVVDLLGGLAELCVDFTWPETKAGRIVLCSFVVFLGGLVWWELR
jgi:hypothetical protein